jgi:hypothetical protein
LTQEDFRPSDHFDRTPLVGKEITLQVAPINCTTFQPGDSILLKAGGSWKGALHPLGSGRAGSPITFGSYGDGAPAAVRLEDQQHPGQMCKHVDIGNNALDIAVKPSRGTGRGDLERN